MADVRERDATRVYFHQHPRHRRRQRESVEHCPYGVRPIVRPDIVFASETQLVARYTSRWGRMRAALIRVLAPVNVRRVPAALARSASFVYTWGMIPIRTPIPYVVELDTPYVLSFYSVRWFRVMRPVLRRMLLSRQCHAIACVSDACRRNLRQELGPEVASKARVVYPVPPARPASAASQRFGGPVRFLFVSTQFALKGGRETVAALSRLIGEGADVELTVVSHPPADIVRELASPRIRFVPATLDKATLLREHFATADVFVLPTLQDSFGLVYLEALAYGLPIVATRLYAMPEMVQEGINGLLLEPPVRYYLPDDTANAALWTTDVGALVEAHRFPEFTTSLLEACRAMLDDGRRRQMADASRELFDARFAPAVRDASFRALFEDSSPSKASG